MSCPLCGAALPAVRVPTSLRQLMWGGWTCSCGAELNALRQPIGGTAAVITVDQVRVTLRSPHTARSQALVVLGGLVAPGLCMLGLILTAIVGSWVLLLLAPLVLGLLAAGLVGIGGLRQRHEVTVSDRAIRWGEQVLLPTAVRGVSVEGHRVRLDTAAGPVYLDPLGETTAVLVQAIETARQAGRMVGSADDVPADLRPLTDRAHRETS
jgi:hypothetical protein